VVTSRDTPVVDAPEAPPSHVFDTEATSALYAQHFDPSFGRRIAEKAVDALGVVRGARVLDVSSGTGVFARTAAPVVGPAGAVVAVDPSPGAIETARRTGVSTSIEWVTAEGSHVPTGVEAFDVVVCQQALHRLGDKVDALRAMREALVPGGRLGITTWGPIEENPAFAALLDATVRSGIDRSGVLQAILDAFAFHRVEDLCDLAVDAGFVDVSCRTVRMLATLPCAAEWVQVYPLLPPLSLSWRLADQATRHQFCTRAVELLRPFEHNGVLRVQAAARLVVARAPLPDL
jgi:ubiquinone/menaquinone biosynthesis C-methylase UbiE